MQKNLNCHHMTLIQFFDLKGTRHEPFIQTSVNRMSQLAFVSALSKSKNISLSSRSHDPFKHGLFRPRLFVVNPQGFEDGHILKLLWLRHEQQVPCSRNHNFQQRHSLNLWFSASSVFFWINPLCSKPCNPGANTPWFKPHKGKDLT